MLMCVHAYTCPFVCVYAREVRLRRTRIHARAREHTHKIMYFESHPITHAPHQSISHHTPYDMKPQVYRIIASANVRIGLTDRNRGGLAVWFSSGDATNMDEIHRLTRVTARGLHLPRQAFNTDTDRGPKGKGRLMRVCGLRRLESPTIERVRRAPARGSGVATTRTRRTTPSSFLA